MEKTYKKIQQYFDKLNNDTSHFINSNDICTPMECVKTMVDSVPKTFWTKSNIKILDCCCGNGNFPAYIATKTSLEDIYFNEINKKRIENLYKYFGNNINLTQKDFLKFPSNEEYDLVVANPPYAKFNNDKRVSKNHNMSRDFICKAIEVTKPGGYVLFIVPNNWMSYADRNVLPSLMSKYQFVNLDINGAKKWFPKVGSSFTWFLLQKKANKKKFSVSNNYVIKDEQKVKLDKNVEYIPLYYSEMVRKIINKTINNCKIPKYNVETSSFLHHHTKAEMMQNKRTEEFKYKIIHTPSQIVWSKIPHKYQDNYKVFLSLTNQYKVFVDNCGMTQSIAFINCKSKEEAEKISNELDNDIYKFLNNITRYGNFNNIRILQHFPLYGSFKLNEEEKKFVKEFNERYYGK
ncbi:MAG: methyltransferase [Bacilli bacterium]|nr:methyltransferase [Bacilli bacterium]